MATSSASAIASPTTREEVTVRNGDIELKGALLPIRRGQHPTVVFAHGSGDAQRRRLEPFFVRLGFAVLSLDKALGSDWRTASMDGIAGDWLAGVEMLKQRPETDPHRIGVHGSSQGGWTPLIMAARSKDIAFLILRVVKLTDASHGFTATKTGNSREFPLQTHMAAGYWDTMRTWLREQGFSPLRRYGDVR